MHCHSHCDGHSCCLRADSQRPRKQHKHGQFQQRWQRQATTELANLGVCWSPGNAPFPEYHNVYVEPSAYAAYEATGSWPEGTQIAKELTTVYENNNDEVGSTTEVSGRGYQQGEFSGLELTVKDSTRFTDMPGGWAYFSFGHKPQPYEATAKAFPAESCNACHAANAQDDFVFTHLASDNAAQNTVT